MSWLLHQTPSIVIAVWTLLGSWVLGNKKSIGWLMGIISEVLWVFYAFWSHSYGFLIGVIFFTIVYYRNWRVWNQHAKATAAG